tara:strand:- start:3015 stop:4013 length:999 start_codon:yes stop_codon:yes gene_type:complete
MIEEDETPETIGAQTEQGDAVPWSSADGWRNENNTLVYQTLDDAQLSWDGRSIRIFIVVDPVDVTLNNVTWSTNDQWYVGETVYTTGGTLNGYFRPLHQWLKRLDPDALKIQLATPELLKIAKFSEKQVVYLANGVPVFKPLTSLSNERPVTEKSSTSSTAGVTIDTSVTNIAKNAGTSTISEVVVGKIPSVDIIKGKLQDKAKSLLNDKLSAFGGIGELIPGAILPGEEGLPPCLPENAPGVDNTVTKVLGPDDAISALRTKAAETASTALDAFGGAGPDFPETVKPNTVTTDTVDTSATDNQSPSVYKYEPLKAGFDRYDFNTGKKVVTI